MCYKILILLISTFSLESRDNPFMPGGELSHEADDILKRATIIRDTFTLQTNSDSDNVQSEFINSTEVVEDTLVSQSSDNTHASPEARPRHNGNLDDSNVSKKSDQSDGIALKDDNLKDQKKQKKCCNVM